MPEHEIHLLVRVVRGRRRRWRRGRGVGSFAGRRARAAAGVVRLRGSWMPNTNASSFSFQVAARLPLIVKPFGNVVSFAGSNSAFFGSPLPNPVKPTIAIHLVGVGAVFFALEDREPVALFRP